MANFYFNEDKKAGRANSDPLNASTKDTNFISKMTRKNMSSRDDMEKIDLDSIEKDTFFSGVEKKESSEYFSSVMKGFVFIFMLLVSLLAIFLIFKTPYYDFYAQKDPYVLESPAGSEVVNPFAKNPNDNSLAQPTIPIIEEGGILSSKDNQLDSELSAVESESKSDITKLVKNNKIAELTKPEVKKPAITKKPEVNVKNTKVVVKSTLAEIKNNKIESNEQVVQEENPSVLDFGYATGKGTQKDSTTNTLQSGQTTDMVWLVSLYSTKDKNELQNRLDRLKSSRPLIFKDAVIYFTEGSVDGVSNYRIAVAKNNSGVAYPSFTSQKEARDYCSSIKLQKLDCFSISVAKGNLVNYLVK